mgnify:CR=1 FL=1
MTAQSDYRVLYNLDATEFFVGTFGPAVPGTLDDWLDYHVDLGITHLLVNVNAKRTNYRSDVWEADWDGYDPDGGVNQPFFDGLDPQRRFETNLFKCFYDWSQGGVEYPSYMLEGARRRGLGAWVSMRMNDDHNPDWPDHPSHSTFWKSHPEWRLNYGLDYEQPEVRRHFMSLLEEICTRFDLDGLELDFQRFWLYFRPGREHQGVPLMNEFMEAARSHTRAAARRLGHPVELAVRVPKSPWIARRHGIDAVVWGRAGLVDLILPSTFWPGMDSDIPIETWKGMLTDTDVRVGVALESGIHSGSKMRVATHEELRAGFVAGLQRGADDIYLFNMFTSPYQTWPREDHDQLIRDACSFQSLSSGPRRHPLLLTRPWSDGEPGQASDLPYRGDHGIFRLHLGPLPEEGQIVQVELVATEKGERPTVSVNGITCPFSGWVEAEHVKRSQGMEEPRRRAYPVPSAALSEGYNLIEVRCEMSIEITWLELAVLPA